jgi:hypothetical protein
MVEVRRHALDVGFSSGVLTSLDEDCCLEIDIQVTWALDCIRPYRYSLLGLGVLC